MYVTRAGQEVRSKLLKRKRQQRRTGESTSHGLTSSLKKRMFEWHHKGELTFSICISPSLNAADLTTLDAMTLMLQDGSDTGSDAQEFVATDSSVCQHSRAEADLDRTMICRTYSPPYR